MPNAVAFDGRMAGEVRAFVPLRRSAGFQFDPAREAFLTSWLSSSSQAHLARTQWANIMAGGRGTESLFMSVKEYRNVQGWRVKDDLRSTRADEAVHRLQRLGRCHDSGNGRDRWRCGAAGRG